MTTIAMLGLGAMGSRMAIQLARAGYEVIGWNRTAGISDAVAQAGVILAPSAAHAVRRADVVVAMLRDDDVSRHVWTDARDGVLQAMRPGTLAIECSTLSPAWTPRLAGHAQTAGLRFLEAPVVGSRPQAEGAQLIFLAAGAARDFEEAFPILSAMGKAAHHVGDIGAGARLKLAVNCLLVAQVVALAEVLATLRHEPAADLALQVLRETPVMSPAALGALGSMVGASYAPMFPVDLASKDLRYLLACAQELDLDASLLRAAGQVLAKAESSGLGGLHLTSVARLYEAAEVTSS
jgi:3-hydroxyisobutyrate dehydrogenase-like beta-hydroxyacid dehydrogenase